MRPFRLMSDGQFASHVTSPVLHTDRTRGQLYRIVSHLPGHTGCRSMISCRRKRYRIASKLAVYRNCGGTVSYVKSSVEMRTVSSVIRAVQVIVVRWNFSGRIPAKSWHSTHISSNPISWHICVSAIPTPVSRPIVSTTNSLKTRTTST